MRWTGLIVNKFKWERGICKHLIESSVEVSTWNFGLNTTQLNMSNSKFHAKTFMELFMCINWCLQYYVDTYLPCSQLNLFTIGQIDL